MNTYHYIGKGRGNFEKEVDEPPAYGWRPRLCVVSLIGSILFISLVCFLLTTLSPILHGSDPPSVSQKEQEHEPLSRSMLRGQPNSETSPHVSRLDDSAPLVATDDVVDDDAAAALVTYDCNDENAKWSANKIIWCCKYYERRCTETNHNTLVSSQAPKDCAINCKLKGITASCRDRVQYAASHELLGKPNACAAAHVLVLHECPRCSGCPLDESGCTTTTTAVGTQAPQLLATLGTPTSLAKSSPGSIRSCNSMCLFNGKSATCLAHVQNASQHDFVKRPNACITALEMMIQMCPTCSDCSIKDAGCAAQLPVVTDSPTPAKTYDCMDGYTNWETAWTSGKKAWCCQQKKGPCPGANALH